MALAGAAVACFRRAWWMIPSLALPGPLPVECAPSGTPSSCRSFGHSYYNTRYGLLSFRSWRRRGGAGDGGAAARPTGDGGAGSGGRHRPLGLYPRPDN
jgi:hypothetical protein